MAITLVALKKWGTVVPLVGWSLMAVAQSPAPFATPAARPGVLPARSVGTPVQRRPSSAPTPAPATTPSSAPAGRAAPAARSAAPRTAPVLAPTTSSAPAVNSAAAVRPKAYGSYRQWSMGMGFWTWTETITLNNEGVRDTDFANYKSDALSVGIRQTGVNWGYNAEGILFVGRAAAGGNSTAISYKAQKNWNAIGARVTGFYRWMREIEVGLAVPVILRDPNWPSPTELKVGGEDVVATGMAVLRIYPIRNLALEQAIGPLGDKGQNIWNLGLIYYF